MQRKSWVFKLGRGVADIESYPVDGTSDLLQPIEALMRGLILQISCEEDVIGGADTIGWRSWLRR